MPQRGWRARIARSRPVLVPLGVYTLSRVLVLGVAATARDFEQPRPSLVRFLAKWDAAYYVTIAREGYPSHLTRVGGRVQQSVHAFFPLFPMLIRAADPVLPGREETAGLTVAMLGGAIAAVLLWRLAARLSGPAVADRVVVLFCFFPGTIVFSWPYAEGVMLPLAIGALLLLLDDRWVIASVLVAFATSTRPNALVFIVACAWVAWRTGGPDVVRRLAHAAAAVMISSAGFWTFVIFVGVRTGEPAAWFRVEHEAWGEGTPWKRLPTTIADEFRNGGPHFPHTVTILFVLIAVVLLVAGLASRQPGWLKAVTVAGVYSAVTVNIAPASTRLQLVAIPAFVVLGERLRGNALATWVGGSAALLSVLVFAYGLVGPPLYMFAP